MRHFRLTSDSFNPILVRELRQMVRSRLIVLAINLYLLVLLLFFGGLLFDYLGNPSQKGFGNTAFGVITAVAVTATTISVVVYTAVRVASDRINEDLLFYSTLSPGQNVRGRWVCGLVLSIMMFSISLPFWVSCYLFRGIDFQVFITVIPVCFVTLQLANLVAIAVFSAVRSWFQMIFYTLLFAGIAWMLGIWWFFTAYFADMVVRGSSVRIYLFGSTSVSGWESFVTLCAMLLVSLVLIPVSAYLFARCNLSPLSSNRMLPVRRWLSWAIFGTLLLCGGDTLLHYSVFGTTNEMPLLAFWTSGTVGVLAAILVLAVCERETWEGRLRRSIPKPIWRRMLVFPLYTGSVNGLFWVFLWTFFLTAAISLFAQINLQGGATRNPLEVIWILRHLIFLMMIFDYSMTAFFLWKILLYRWVPREMIWTITLGLLAAVSFGTFFATFLVNDHFVGLENGILLAPNPFLIFADNDISYFQVVCGVAWFSLIILAGYPWLKGRFLDFTPAAPESPEVADP